MKKLLNTLYITSKDAYLGLDGENIVVMKQEQETVRVPLHNIEGIVAFNYTGASPALMGECSKRNIALTFLTSSGRFLSRITGEIKGNVLLRKKQYRISENADESALIAKSFLIGKIFNSKWVIERAIRDYSERLNVDKLKSASISLSNSLNFIKSCNEYNSLLGLEGEAAATYFSVFNDLILQQKEDFFFDNRNRRPALDNVNAMLSFAYTLLAHEAAGALESVGLDAYVGYLHKDRPGRISLALDLMEEFRSIFCDRFVITLINKRIINNTHFYTKENRAVFFTDEGRKIFLNAWQNKKQEFITHPFLNEKIEWGLAIYTQALLLSRYLRGDLDAYPPFFWK